ncbi:hypothetical protein HDU99_006067 [Rhizoclosmatium hyalinum]|nr:hypothetical protein HDU99_006067 [Rhizoclosmatium hyalinum]
MILTETVSHIQKLQAELESMSRALAAADSKCFSLVAELHRMSCVTGLQPNLDAIQESSSNVAPLSPISSPSSSNSENGEEESRKRVRSQSPTHDSVHLPPLKRQNGDVASTSSNQSQINNGFFATPHSPTTIQLPPLASSLSGSLRPAPGVALTQAPTLSRSVSPISTQVSSPPLSSASTQSIVTPVSSFVDRVDGRIIMKAGRRKGTGNSTATKRPVDVSTVSAVPALLFRVPSPTS